MIAKAVVLLAPRMVKPRLVQPTRLRAVYHGSAFSARRSFASSRSADEVMDVLQELYATAKDEVLFEMAAEETEKKTVYASKDREAAKEALQRLKDTFDHSLKLSSPSEAEEIRARVGQRIRELNNAYTALEELAHED